MKLLITYKFDKYYSLNKAFSSHWSEYSKIKKEIMHEVKLLTLNAIRHHNIKDEDNNNYYYEFYLEYNFDNDRIDTDNFAFMRKSIIDGINQTNLIKDDSFKYCSIYDKKYAKSSDKFISVFFVRKKLKTPHTKELKRKIANHDTSKWNYPNRTKKNTN